MNSADLDDDGFADELLARFEGFGSDASKPRQRRKRERAAALTPEQRKRRGPPTEQVNFRATEPTRAILKQLAAKLDKSQGQVIADALESLAAQHGIGGKQ